MILRWRNWRCWVQQPEASAPRTTEKDGSIAVTRSSALERHESADGWGSSPPRAVRGLLAFLVTEASSPAYWHESRGGAGLSTSCPPHVSHASYEMSVTLAEMFGAIAKGVSSLRGRDAAYHVTTLSEAIESGAGSIRRNDVACVPAMSKSCCARSQIGLGEFYPRWHRRISGSSTTTPRSG